MPENPPLPANVLPTAITSKSPRFEKNQRALAELVGTLRTEAEQICEGGGTKAIAAQHKKGRLTARERIAKLIDEGTAFFELALYQPSNQSRYLPSFFSCSFLFNVQPRH